MLHYLNKFNNKEYLFNGDYKKINFLFFFSDFLLIISPTNYPGFALAWLDLILIYIMLLLKKKYLIWLNIKNILKHF